MDTKVKAFPWWIWFAAEIIIFTISALVAEHYRTDHDKEFSIVIGLLALLVTVCLHIIVELRKVASEVAGLPRELTRDAAVQSATLAHTFVAIRSAGDPLFTGIAEREIQTLTTTLNQLKNGEFRASGGSLYRAYEQLIDSLQERQTYFATTFVDDAFWKTEGGTVFLRRNVEAVKRGALVTRIFFYRKDKDSKLSECPVVKMHNEVREKLNSKEKARFELRSLEVSSRAVRDLGILNKRYLLRITSDAHTDEADALVSIESTVVKRAHEEWENLYRISDPL